MEETLAGQDIKYGYWMINCQLQFTDFQGDLPCRSYSGHIIEVDKLYHTCY